MEILFSFAIFALIFVIVSWIMPTFPALLTALSERLYRELSRTVKVYIIVLAVSLGAIAMLLLVGLTLIISLSSLLAMGVIMILTFLGFYYRNEISAWLASHGLDRRILGLIVFSLVLILAVVFSVVFGREVISAIAFITVIILTLSLWFPHGVIAKIFGYSGNIIPITLRMAIAWISFIAIFGLLYPGKITVTFLLVIILVAILLLVTSARSAWLRGSLTAVVVVMCLIAVWQEIMPDNFRAVSRHVEARGGQINTYFDRSSIESEAEAAVTYARLNRDVTVLYSSRLVGGQLYLTSVAKQLAKDVVLKLVDHKAPILERDGQGFVQVQMLNRYGTFVGGKKYWIEADYLDPITPSQWRVLLSRSELKIEPVVSPSPPTPPPPSPPTRDLQKISGYFSGPGQYFMAGPGGETGWIEVGPCLSYWFTKGTRITLFYQDGSFANSWEVKKWPNKERFKLKNHGNQTVSLIITGTSS